MKKGTRYTVTHDASDFTCLCNLSLASITLTSFFASFIFFSNSSFRHRSVFGMEVESSFIFQILLVSISRSLLINRFDLALF